MMWCNVFSATMLDDVVQQYVCSAMLCVMVQREWTCGKEWVESTQMPLGIQQRDRTTTATATTH